MIYDAGADQKFHGDYSGASPESCIKYYWTLFAQWREAGVKFPLGSDLHSANANIPLSAASGLLPDCCGFREENIRYLFEQQNS